MMEQRVTQWIVWIMEINWEYYLCHWIIWMIISYSPIAIYHLFFGHPSSEEEEDSMLVMDTFLGFLLQISSFSFRNTNQVEDKKTSYTVLFFGTFYVTVRIIRLYQITHWTYMVFCITELCLMEIMYLFWFCKCLRQQQLQSEELHQV